MILVIQICLAFLAGYVLWCEKSPHFANTVKSILLVRFLATTSCIGLAYNAQKLINYSYPIQFFTMLFVLLSTFVIVKFIIKRYKDNLERLEKVNNKLANYKK